MTKTPPISKSTSSIREGFHEIIDALCGRFAGLSPFEIMNTDLEDVYSLYVDVIIHDRKASQGKIGKRNDQEGVWVTSETATWH